MGDILTNYGNWELYSETPFYLDAYQVELNSIWAKTDFNNELQNIAYYRALTSMLRDNEIGDYQRRQLLRSYMKPDFSADDTKDPINKLFSIMPTDNLYVKRALRNLCVVYNERPSRKIEGKNANIIEELYEQINIDSKYLKLHRIAKLTNELAVTLQFHNQKPVLRYITPDNYRLKYDDYGNEIELWIPYTEYVDKSPVTYYKVWTRDEYYILDNNLNKTPFQYAGKTFISLPNQMGEIPYVFIKLDTDKDEYLEQSGGGLYELVKAQLNCNKLDFLVNENIVYNGFAVWLLKNWDIKNNNIKLSPGAAFIAEGISGMDGLSEPTAETVQPSAQFLDIEELKSTKIKKTLKNLGLPSGLIEDNPGLTSSGVAMRIDRMELEEVRKEDIAVFRNIEDKIVNKFAKILNTDYASPYKNKLGGEYITKLDYIEQSTFLEPKEEFEYNKMLFEYGMITPQVFVNRTISNDYITDDKAAIQYLKTNRQLINELKGQSDGLGKPSADADKGIKDDENDIETGSEPNAAGNEGTNIRENN